MKGSMIDLSYIIIILVVATISFLIAYIIYDAFADEWLSKYGSSATQQNIIGKSGLAFTNLINGIPFIVIGSGIVVLILAFMIPANPSFLIIAIISWVIYTFVGIIYTNFLWFFVNSTDIVLYANQFPMLTTLIQYFPYIISTIGALLIIVMYSKGGDYNA